LSQFSTFPRGIFSNFGWFNPSESGIFLGFSIYYIHWTGGQGQGAREPESHIKALRQLCEASKEVHIVSYVESEKREK
jgi:hypothetical protein